jgi:hypothetical protein
VGRTCKTWTAKLWAAALLLCAVPGAAQGPPPPQAAADPATEARFLALKATSDAARARGQLARATQAYLDALAIRKDPTVHGRLGMVAAKAGAHDAAAFHLLIACNAMAKPRQSGQSSRICRMSSGSIMSCTSATGGVLPQLLSTILCPPWPRQEGVSFTDAGGSVLLTLYSARRRSPRGAALTDGGALGRRRQANCKVRQKESMLTPPCSVRAPTTRT